MEIRSKGLRKLTLSFESIFGATKNTYAAGGAFSGGQGGSFLRADFTGLHFIKSYQYQTKQKNWQKTEHYDIAFILCDIIYSMCF